ncbi:hypothetical protein [Gluconobacter japonicus]|uniref:hypothetical protein n=1 Tax=Gluconobacter japonicus TaxID=376620 RepID=UPI0039ED73B5
MNCSCATATVSSEGDVLDQAQRDLLLSLAYMYASCDREPRALPLLLLVAAENPDDCDCLRLLAHVYTAMKRGELALIVLDRIRRLRPTEEPGDALLRARALHRTGRFKEAQTAFSVFAQSNVRALAL